MGSYSSAPDPAGGGGAGKEVGKGKRRVASWLLGDIRPWAGLFTLHFGVDSFKYAIYTISVL